MAEPVRVLVVDDSSFFRKRIRRYLEESPDISVIGEAADGAEALSLNEKLSPDLVTMDVAMPVLDGIEAVRRIMRDHPTAIIMFSALTREGAHSTLEALDAGAVDFLPKTPPNGSGDNMGSLLRERVLDIARSRQHRHAPSSKPRETRVAAGKTRDAHKIELVVIGASTGGPVAVQQILAGLPGNFPYPVLVAVHMPGTFTRTYAERLDSLCALRVREAADGDRLTRGQVLVAPGGFQTDVKHAAGGLSVRIREDAGQLYKPSVDNTFSTACDEVGDGVLAIVLTGMGSDGAKGAWSLKCAGATVWAQDQASSVVYGMPQAVARAGAADRVLSLQQIAEDLREIR